jgi:hypothetical protein
MKIFNVILWINYESDIVTESFMGMGEHCSFCTTGTNFVIVQNQLLLCDSALKKATKALEFLTPIRMAGSVYRSH